MKKQKMYIHEKKYLKYNSKIMYIIRCTELYTELNFLNASDHIIYLKEKWNNEMFDKLQWLRRGLDDNNTNLLIKRG